MIPTLKKKFRCNVGYSGHEKGGLAVSYAAVALGATSLERHLTLDRNMYGSDQVASITPEGFKRLVGGIKMIESCIKDRGSEKKILEMEIEVSKKLRSHIKN